MLNRSLPPWGASRLSGIPEQNPLHRVRVLEAPGNLDSSSRARRGTQMHATARSGQDTLSPSWPRGTVCSIQDVWCGTIGCMGTESQPGASATCPHYHSKQGAPPQHCPAGRPSPNRTQLFKAGGAAGESLEILKGSSRTPFRNSPLHTATSLPSTRGVQIVSAT